MAKTAICPGSFDPITVGHVRLIERTAETYDRVLVCVADNDVKTYDFCAEERVLLCQKALSHLANVTVMRCEGMLVDFFREQGGDVIVKGVRDEADLRYEKEMAGYNKSLEPTAETVFLETEEAYKEIRSSLLKKRMRDGQDVTAWIPQPIAKDVYKKFVDNI